VLEEECPQPKGGEVRARIGHYMYLFERLTPIFGGRFTDSSRWCHIVRAKLWAKWPLTIYPNRPEKPRLFQSFDKRIVKKFSCIGILGLGEFFLVEMT